MHLIQNKNFKLNDYNNRDYKKNFKIKYISLLREIRISLKTCNKAMANKEKITSSHRDISIVKKKINDQHITRNEKICKIEILFNNKLNKSLICSLHYCVFQNKILWP